MSRPPKENKSKDLLSDREVDVLELLAEGLVKKEIAKQRGISVTTVAFHVRNIYEKLEVQNAPAAVATAFKLGILKTPPQPPGVSLD